MYLWAPWARRFLAGGGWGPPHSCLCSFCVVSFQTFFERLFFRVGSGNRLESSWFRLRNQTVSGVSLGPPWKPDRVWGQPGSDVETRPCPGSAWVRLGNQTGSRSNLSRTRSSVRPQGNKILLQGWTIKLTLPKIILNYSGHSGEL